MLTFADTAWQALSALLAFLTGLLFALLQRPHFRIPTPLAAGLYFWHTAFCLYYYNFSLANIADAPKYFRVSLNFDEGFAFGTPSIYWLTSLFSRDLNMSYGATFLVYNVLGYIGLLGFSSALLQITRDAEPLKRKLAIATLFLPGISFWSSAIGKDALAFMAAGLMIWALTSLRRHYMVFGFSLIVLFVVRPHIGGIAFLSFCFAYLLSTSESAAGKILVTLIAVPIAAAIGSLVLGYVGLTEAEGLDDVAEYIESRQGYNLDGGSSIDISTMSWPERLFSYLFRPLPFESSGLMSIIVGLENMFLIVVFLLLAGWTPKLGPALTKFAAAFFFIFGMICLVVLANTTSSLGIAIRQKWMFMPMLLCIAFSLTRNVTKT